MRIQIKLVNDNEGPEDLVGCSTYRLDKESALRIYTYVEEVLRKEFEKYVTYYKKRDK